ncbi:folylpolyglutamate synthase/dihydrofolate synthase family protein [Bacillus sp. FJAT-49736]|uniref:bifunctional folylpolyglutamate synthase/dihydrofolate synthase n=1 Tax=Bacillus sp. FJAT-49736 TaxID=2833582 RepID=UPI001BC992D0|nr:folylpolyglutamate synthase/dihydrofolate synthase family protein [Bacillus sp. FJAT-49736]MBS4173719.1 bifunctional folylpolyglutamate synthase/dihydrofolate synthase [Bacillus sp. FJAT-49736]
MNTYEEALDWILSRLQFGMKPGLDRMKWMMEKLGSPEKDLKVIHVGGTNGKGSTVTYIRSILNEAGYSVGTFTSPAIESFNERISLNGIPISNSEMMDLVNIIKPLVEELAETELGPLTEFEVITTMAIYYFSKVNPVDYTVFEVGLGGRLDSTNILEPILTVITNIGLDHVNILGDTVEKIAFEKAGIIKKNIPLITAVEQYGALTVIEEKAEKMNSIMYVLGRDFQVGENHSIETGESFCFSVKDRTLKDLEIGMIGYHQTKNASLAVMVSVLLDIDEAFVRRGLLNAMWPGRMEIVQKNPLILVDGAHNPEGVEALVKAINKRYSTKKKKVLFAALRDKELTKMFVELRKLEADFYFTQFQSPRIESAAKLAELSKVENGTAYADWKPILTDLIKGLNNNEMLIICGSLYFLAEIKPFLKNIIS